MSEHGLDGELEEMLLTFVTFTVQVYHQMFFLIKVLHNVKHGPRHVLTLLQLVRRQPEVVQDIVLPYVQSGAWFAHSEAIILSLVCSQDRQEREFGVKKILEIRGERELGDIRVRHRRTPALKFDATSLTSLIEWEKDTHEPIFTAKLSKADILSLADVPLPVPKYSVHTQSVEWSVKQETEAASSVAGFKSRDGFIRSRMEHRAVMPKFSTKQDILTLFK